MTVTSVLHQAFQLLHQGDLLSHTLMITTWRERNIARHVMDWNLQGTWKRGRPRIKWRRSIQKDLMELVRDQKSSSRPSEAKGNLRCPLPSMGKRGLQCSDDYKPDLVQPVLLSLSFLLLVQYTNKFKRGTS